MAPGPAIPLVLGGGPRASFGATWQRSGCGPGLDADEVRDLAG